MAVHAITLELPDDIYQRAQLVAKTTRRSLEEVVGEWIRPPMQVTLPELERLSDDELLQTARATLPPEHILRLQELLTVQQQRNLSEVVADVRGAVRVPREDLEFTLRDDVEALPRIIRTNDDVARLDRDRHERHRELLLRRER